MKQNEMKVACAQKALDYIEDDMIIGVGTGSTVDYFIEALVAIKHRIAGTVASSLRTSEKLKSFNIPVYDLNTIDQVQLYVDGADEIDGHFQMIKGGGGAHMREKLLATVAQQFICIADESKQVELLGNAFPIPVEVIPMARSYVARELVKLGRTPVYRDGVVTDNGNIILDVYGDHFFNLSQTPLVWEERLNQITGVVENGIFAKRTADRLLLARQHGEVEVLLNKRARS